MIRRDGPSGGAPEHAMTIPAADQAKAAELHELARTLDDEAALAMYEEVLGLDPNRPDTHYNIGLIFKYQGKWRESFSHNRRSVALDPDSEAANWNLAIAATALRDWHTAREVWHRLGMPIEPGDSPIVQDFGLTPVRLNPEGDAEVVWARRIDPVRARIESIPFPGSGYRCGDVVLHDGAAVGHRKLGDQDVPVFNVLELFDTSLHGTFEAEVRAGSQADIDALCALLEEADVDHEDWTTNIRVLCKQCSEGVPHDHHDAERNDEFADRHVLGIATDQPAVVEALLQRWRNANRSVVRFELMLTPPVRH